MPEIQVSRTNRTRSRAHAGRRAGLVLALVLGTVISVLGLLASLEPPADDVVLRVPTSPGGLPVVPDVPGDDPDGEPLVRPRDDRPAEPEPPTSSSPPEVRTVGADLDSDGPVDPPADPSPGPAADVPVPQGPADVPAPDPDPSPTPEPSDEPDPVRDLVDEITGAAPATEPAGDALIDVLDLLDLPVRHTP